MDRIRTFVLNLTRSPDRLERVSHSLASAGIPFTRLDAVDGATLSAEERNAPLSSDAQALRPGEIGCFLSHRLAATAFLESDAELGLVLEDDATVRPDAKACLEAFERNWRVQTLWDVANLGRPAKHYMTPIRAAVWDGPVQLFHAHYMPITTTALLWTRGGARAFLGMSKTFSLPVDAQIQAWVAETQRGLALARPLFSPDKSESTIHGRGDRSAAFMPKRDIGRVKRIARAHALGIKGAWQTQRAMT